jgi:formiminotetrahydrofolate cyclodeaminase
MSRLTDRPLRELLAAFADSGPTPGGGSASALAASVGLSLLAMVSAMHRTRNGTDDERALLDRAHRTVEHLGDHALTLVDDDAAAYEAVVGAYRRPKATDEERADRTQAIQSALHGAVEVPLEVMRTCRAGRAAAVDVARAGNPSASSDIGVAVELLGAAARGAALNVHINLGSLDDAGYSSAVAEESGHLESAAATLSKEVRAALS